MLKAIVVDDEALTAEHIGRLLESCGAEVAGYYSNPLEALDRIMLDEPDVIFLDIEMPEISGLELAEGLHAKGYEGEIVFITAYRQYAIDAFTVNALDYLLKPVTEEGLQKAIRKAMKRRKLPLRESVKTGGRIKVSLLGNLSVIVGAENAPIRWMTAKCAEVFAFMLLQKEGGEVSKWKLMEAVWPDKDTVKADINLRSTISRLNKTLRENTTGISMISAGSGYRLTVKDAELEVDAFQLEKLALDSVAVTHENAEYYNRVISSYKAMLLEEFDSEWCIGFRECCHRYFINAAKKLMRYYDAVDEEPLKILNLVEMLVKYEPYDDQFRDRELRLHHKIGGKQSLETCYRKYRDLLRRDLDEEPSDAIRLLYRDLINQS